MALQARRIHVDELIEPHSSLSQDELLQSPHALASDIEAIIGAVWVDSERDFDAVEGVMRRLHIYPD
jgi:dsRNA-specific ribonuclease